MTQPLVFKSLILRHIHLLQIFCEDSRAYHVAGVWWTTHLLHLTFQHCSVLYEMGHDWW